MRVNAIFTIVSASVDAAQVSVQLMAAISMVRLRAAGMVSRAAKAAIFGTNDVNKTVDGSTQHRTMVAVLKKKDQRLAFDESDEQLLLIVDPQKEAARVAAADC